MTKLLLRLKKAARSYVDERGAMLPLLGMSLFTLMGVGALAVDVSSLSSAGQGMQNAADAASLAGVTEWVDSGSKSLARQRARDVAEQNGLKHGGDLRVRVTFPSPNKVRVVVQDNAPQVFLGELIGYGDKVEREAVANFLPCDVVCSSTNNVPEPAKPISYNGSGDGYRPVVLGDRVYAPRHHNNLMGCVDRNTNDKCWTTGDKAIFESGTYSLNTTHPYVYGDKIFVLGFNNGQGTNEYANTGAFNQGTLHLTCWDTTFDIPCPTTIKIPNERHGILAATTDGLFVMTAHSKVYCYDPGTLIACSGYPKDTASIGEGWDERYTSMRNSTYRDFARKIYFTIGDDKQTRNGQHHIQCWDTFTNLACSGWGVHAVNSDFKDAKGDIAIEGRLFFYRNTDSVPVAICSTGKGTGDSSNGANRVDCFDLIGGAPYYPATAFENFVNGWDDMRTSSSSNGAWTSSGGQHTFHLDSNRTFFLGQHTDHKTYCWDWDGGPSSGLPCPTSVIRHTDSPSPYGYWPTAECLFGLGHKKKFFTLAPNMTEGCLSGSLEISLGPCTCGGITTWPDVRVNNLELVDKFKVRVLDESKTTVLYPPAPDDWVDFVAGQDIDLESILGTSTDPVWIEVVATPLTNENPWADGDFPQLILVPPGLLPHLVE